MVCQTHKRVAAALAHIWCPLGTTQNQKNFDEYINTKLSAATNSTVIQTYIQNNKRYEDFNIFTISNLKNISAFLEEIKSKLHLETTPLSSIQYVIQTFLNFSWIFLKNVTLTIFSIIVHYITLLVDVIEVTFTSFLMISSGVEAQKGSVGQIFAGLVKSGSELLGSPAILAGLGVATSGIGTAIVKGLSMTGSATAAAMNANNEARTHGEQFKAQGFNNMAGFVAKNPTGVVFFTTKFIRLFFKFGIAGPFTLLHRMTETLCDYTGLAKDADDDVEEAGRKASEIMLKQLNDSIVKGTNDFSIMNRKAMNTSWSGIKSSATRFTTDMKKYLSTRENKELQGEEKVYVSSPPVRKPRGPSKRRVPSGIDKANILPTTTKRTRRAPARYRGGRKKIFSK